MTYRRDIDGLRAVAVLSVLAYHYFPPVLPAGFIGVDVFFVISGYLISLMIFSEVARSTFSIASFYRRRINRIFPALATVLATTLALGWIALFPDEYASLGRNALASTAFLENIFLWMQSGYFDADAVRKPLLHIWSLGVEEQFYILYPPLLVVANRLRILNMRFLLACCLLSFLLSLVVVGVSQSTDFYFPFTRFWELSVGGILAWRERDAAAGAAPSPRSLVPPVALSLAGLAALLLGFFLFDARTPFPGAAALLPVLGAAAIIAAGQHALPNRLLLSNRAAVFVGKISYPLYLWHWPLLSFLFIVNIEKPEPPIRVVLVVLAVLLATATWLLIETPIRRRHNNGRAALVLLAVMVAVGASGWGVARDGGLPWRAVNRINGGAVVRASGIDSPPLPVHDCAVPASVARTFRNCIQDRGGGTPDFVLLGDSKADALYRGLMASSRPGGRWLYLGGADATTFGAPLPLVSANPAWAPVQHQSRAAIDFIRHQPGIRVVLYAAALRNLYQIDDNGAAGRLFTAYDPHYLKRLNGSPLAPATQAAVVTAVGALVASGKIVAMLVDNPPLPPLRACNGRLTASATLNRLLDLRSGARDPACRYPIAQYRQDARVYLRMLAAVKARFGAKVVILDLTNLYCRAHGGQACGTSAGSNALYGYTDHPSHYTAALVGAAINARLQPYASPARP